MIGIGFALSCCATDNGGALPNITKEKVKVMKNLLVTIAVLLCSASIVFAAPRIDSAEGTFVDGQIVNIQGGSFGTNGPNILLFDDFSGGRDGEALANNAIIGQWTQMRGIAYADPLLSKGVGARLITTSGHVINRLSFGHTYSEVFATSRAYVPQGYRFPAASALKTMPSISALKHHWFYYGDRGYAGGEGPDLFSTNWTGNKFYCTASNESHEVWQDQNCLDETSTRSNMDVWAWDEPVRWTFWVKGNGVNIEGSEGFFQSVHSQKQTNLHYDSSNMSAPWFRQRHIDQGYPLGFDRMTVVGYFRGGSYPSDNYVIDDVYVAVGPNAAARVEIGNHSVYSSCTKLAISTPTQWSNTSIRATIRGGNFKSGETAYLFVVDGQNNASNGYRITIGGKSDQPVNPEVVDAPTNLEIISNN